MTLRENHVTVCVCTYKRPDLLSRLLTRLQKQSAQDFTYSIVIADNDQRESARAPVTAFAAQSSIRAVYCVEPRQNIALARNKALENSEGEFIAFIDDDEVPGEDWLTQLLAARRQFEADGVLGPVRPYFDSEPPRWVKRGNFFDRPEHPTGSWLKWNECRTGNVLFRRRILAGLEEPFRSEFGTGEDMDFFRRMIDQGYKFVWCQEAPANELIPPERCRRSFLLRRAMLRGSDFPKHPVDKVKNVVKSIVAVPTYALALPILLGFGQHVFLKYLIKLCDHSSRLLAFSRMMLVNKREI